MIYYLSPTGNDAYGVGTIASPWRTIYHATEWVHTAGDKIYLFNGTYNEVHQSLLADGVSLEGENMATVIVESTIAGSSLLKLETANGWSDKTTGNQSISEITFRGNLTTNVGIAVNFRHDVLIHNCTFQNFVRSAVTFWGQPTNYMTINNPYKNTGNSDTLHLPDNNGFCEGNKFYNNIVTNCCGLISGTDFSGAVQWGTQDGWECRNNSITTIGRSGDGNGMAIKFHDTGFNRNTKIYNNTINSGRQTQNHWQFAIEIWWDLGGTEIYNNTSTGAFDLCDSWDQYGAGYGMKVYGNNIGYTTLSNAAYPANMERGILFEGTHIETYLFGNLIHHVTRAITGNNTNWGPVVYDGVYIYDNICYELGQTSTNWQTWGFQWDVSVTATSLWQNIFIRHNIFIASTSCLDPTTYGIMIPTVSHLTNFYVENNILINWERGAILGTGARTVATNIFLRNNLIIDSFNNNDPSYINGFPTAGVTYSGTIKSDPLFVSSTDYHLSSVLSPAYHAGIDADIILDYDGNTFHATTPSIGAYELGSAPPATTPVTNITVSGTGGVDYINVDDGTLQMIATVLPVDATDPSVTWSVIAGTGTASISATGLLTALTNGTVTVRATANDGSGVFDDMVITLSYQVDTIVKKNIAPVGWHVATETDWEDLIDFLVADVGGKLKETGLVYWDTPNTGATNEAGFNAKGAGERHYLTGAFSGLRGVGSFWTSTEFNAALAFWIGLSNNSANIQYFQTANKPGGKSVRCVKDDSVDPGSVTDYDGNVYATKKFGTKVWMVQNLAVTHFNDGTPIPNITDDAEWAATAVAAMCWYNNLPS